MPSEFNKKLATKMKGLNKAVHFTFTEEPPSLQTGNVGPLEVRTVIASDGVETIPPN